MRKPEDFWRKFRYSEGLHVTWLEAGLRDPGAYLFTILLQNPILRIGYIYEGYGMSLHGLARVTLKEPKEVFEQVKREGMQNLFYCYDTRLMVLERPWRVPDRKWIRPEIYARKVAEYNTRFASYRKLPSFEQMLEKYPLKKSRLCFNPHKMHTHRIYPDERKALIFAYTLGLSEKEARKHLA